MEMKYSSNLLRLVAWNLDIDLVSDMQTMLYKKLVKAGYRNVNLDRALYQYFNAQKRMVSRRSRKVHISKEFKCPELYEVALDNFVMKVEGGDSLLPFLSNKLLDASYSDGMLNDWNIYHFHLTNRFNKDGWAKRSDYELFTYVTDTDMYLLQVYEHNDPLLYWRREIIKILNANWPELLDKFRLKEVHSLAEKFDDEQYKQLREALRAADFWHNHLKKVQNFFVENMDVLCGPIGQESKSEWKEYKVSLRCLALKKVKV